MKVTFDEKISLHDTYFDEMFHYVMQAAFKNGGQPYAENDAAAKKAHIDAIVADTMLDGEKPNPAAIRKLGLEDYVDKRVGLKQQLEEACARDPISI